MTGRRLAAQIAARTAFGVVVAVVTLLLTGSVGWTVVALLAAGVVLNAAAAGRGTS